MAGFGYFILLNNSGLYGMVILEPVVRVAPDSASQLNSNGLRNLFVSHLNLIGPELVEGPFRRQKGLQIDHSKPFFSSLKSSHLALDVSCNSLSLHWRQPVVVTILSNREQLDYLNKSMVGSVSDAQTAGRSYAKRNTAFFISFWIFTISDFRQLLIYVKM